MFELVWTCFQAKVMPNEVMLQNDAPFHYRLKRTTESFSGSTLEIEGLEDLDKTIDDLFAHLEIHGNPAHLEKLFEELCPYFGIVWPSARALTEHLVKLGSENLAGKSILEVGCGLAVPSLLATRLGAHVTATDFHPEVPRFLARNILLNQAGSLKYIHADWQKDPSPITAHFDWVIGSDILYERQHATAVAKTLARHVHSNGRILVADPARPYLQNFVDEMKRLGFNNESQIKKEIFVIEFSRTARP